MQLETRNPNIGIYSATKDYVHALEVIDPKKFLFVSGTMGLDIEGVAAANLDLQLELIWSNLRTILSSASMDVGNVVRATSYLRDSSYAEANQNARVAALQGRVIPTTTIVAQTLTSEWMAEIEIVACA